MELQQAKGRRCRGGQLVGIENSEAMHALVITFGRQNMPVLGHCTFGVARIILQQSACCCTDPVLLLLLHLLLTSWCALSHTPACGGLPAAVHRTAVVAVGSPRAGNNKALLTLHAIPSTTYPVLFNQASLAGLGSTRGELDL